MAGLTAGAGRGVAPCTADGRIYIGLFVSLRRAGSACREWSTPLWSPGGGTEAAEHGTQEHLPGKLLSALGRARRVLLVARCWFGWRLLVIALLCRHVAQRGKRHCAADEHRGESCFP